MRRVFLATSAAAILGARAMAAQTVDSIQAASWRDDLRTLARELPARHPNAFSQLSRESFSRAVAELDSAIPRLSARQIHLRLARIVALLHDAHTALAPPQYDTRLPLQILWEQDGPYVANADDANRAAIGRRITRLNGRPISEVADSIRQYLSIENEQGLRASGSYFLVRPAALRDIGLAADTNAAVLELAGEGVPSIEVRAVPARGFVTPRRVDPPLYRQRAGERYWWTYLPAERTVYVKYNECVDAAAFRALSDSVMRAIDDRRPLRVVVDLRDNAGGNSSVVQPLIDGLRSRASVNQRDALYVIFGRGTFSSGLIAAVELKKRTNATSVGEPTAEHPNHFGEVKSFELPGSHLRVNHSTTLHRLVDGNPDALEPDVDVPPTTAAFVAGRDPAMEWILAHSRTSER